MFFKDSFERIYRKCKTLKKGVKISFQGRGFQFFSPRGAPDKKRPDLKTRSFLFKNIIIKDNISTLFRDKKKRVNRF